MYLLLQNAVEQSQITPDKFIQAAATIFAALSGGTVGAWVGAQFALRRFKRERAFDRRLDWYARMIRFLLDMAGGISIAVTYEHDIEVGIDADPQGTRSRVWTPVQLSHLELRKLSLEGEIYATARGLSEIRSTAKAVEEVAAKTNSFYEQTAHEHIKEITLLINLMTNTASFLAGEGRAHLGLK